MRSRSLVFFSPYIFFPSVPGYSVIGPNVCVKTVWMCAGNLDALPLCNFTCCRSSAMSQFHLHHHCTCIEPVPNCRAVKTSWLAWPVPSLSLNVWWCRNQIFVSIRQGSPLSISQSQRQRQVQSSYSWLSELMWMQAFTLSRMAGKLLIASAQRKAKLDLSTHKHMLVGIQEHPVFSLAIFWVGSKDFPLCFL